MSASVVWDSDRVGPWFLIELYHGGKALAGPHCAGLDKCGFDVVAIDFIDPEVVFVNGEFDGLEGGGANEVEGNPLL